MAGNEAIIADAILPKLAEFGTFQGLANSARVINRRDALMQETQDALRCVLPEFVQLPFG